MSLRAFHLFFIVISTLLALFMLGWGIYDYRATGESLGIFLAVVGALGLMGLVKYFRWFQSKHFEKLSMLTFGFLSAAWLSFGNSSVAQACAVCYSDPDSPMTKGALTGVLVLLAVIVTVLSLIFALALSWVKRAKSLSMHF